MAVKSGKNNLYLKNFNQAVILNLIRTNKSISKAQLSLLTGLTPTAIGKITAKLIELGYIYEKGIGYSKGGRKPILLELKEGSYFSIGMAVDLNYFHLIIMDITGKVKYEKEQSLPNNITFEEYIIKAEKTAESSLKNLSIRSDRLLGIGFSIPGIIDNKAQKLIFAPNMGWENIDLNPYYNYFLPVPVYFENEANASAICEHWLGLCQKDENFVCLNIKSGLGAGIFANGKIYNGNNGFAGEIGHTVADESGPKCRCGNTGCFETFVSVRHIVENYKTQFKNKTKSVSGKIMNIDDLNINHIIAAAREGDNLSARVLLDSAKYLGTIIAQIINTLNPAKIVIGKEFIKYADLVIDQIKITVARKSLKYLNSSVEIISSETGEKSSTLGAAIIPLKILFGKE